MKKVSVSTATVIKEIAPLYGISEMEAGILLKWKDGDEMPRGGLKGKIVERLEEKRFIEVYYDAPWSLSSYLPCARTEKGKLFVSAVEARKETRILFNMGCDLFPEMANIAM